MIILIFIIDIFFNLNQRFNKLISSRAKICIHLGSFSKKKFLGFCFKLHQFIIITENYPLSIQSYNEQELLLLLNDNLFQNKFFKQKSLSLINVKVSNLFHIIFDGTIKLYKTLERLNLICEISGEEHEIERKKVDFSRRNEIYSLYVDLCKNLISSKLNSLKYLRLNFQPYLCGCKSSFYRSKDYIDLTFEDLSEEENLSNNLETIFIGCE